MKTQQEIAEMAEREYPYFSEVENLKYITELERSAFIKGHQAAQEEMKWIDCKNRHLLPCYESGDWNGLRSDFILLLDNKNHQCVGRCYSGTLDGCEFDCFYGTDDYEIKNVTHWMHLPQKPLNL